VNRRYFGLAFAASHAIHLWVIVTYWDQGVGAFMNSQPYVGFVANVIGYIVIALMAATSFKAPRLWLGPKVWSALHTWGSYYIWLSFAKSFLPRALVMPGYWLPVVLLFGAVALRWMASRKQRVASST
jgi:methionine sulfoxide reductase heme-binding subunit